MYKKIGILSNLEDAGEMKRRFAFKATIEYFIEETEAALRRAGLPSATRTWLAVTAVLVVWYGLVSYLSMQGAFQATPDVKFPAIVVAVLLPIIGGLWLIVRSRTMTAVIDATPLSWLVAIQAYRVAGFVFLILLSMHQLPAQFALPAKATCSSACWPFRLRG